MDLLSAKKCCSRSESPQRLGSNLTKVTSFPGTLVDQPSSSNLPPGSNFLEDLHCAERSSHAVKSRLLKMVSIMLWNMGNIK